MDRRSFIAAAAVAPLAGGALAAPTDPNEKLLQLIEFLETEVGWEVAAVAWCKAWVAGEIRGALGMEVIESQSRQHHIDDRANQWRHEQRRLVEVAKYKARRAVR